MLWAARSREGSAGRSASRRLLVCQINQAITAEKEINPREVRPKATDNQKTCVSEIKKASPSSIECYRFFCKPRRLNLLWGTMELVLYNTLSKQKEAFAPLRAGQVKMYVCGPTVYDLLHVGNFRGAIFFNLVCNWLEQQGLAATYVYNYTDIDDKIIQRAEREGVPASEIGERYIAEFEKDFARLNLRSHDHNPRATQHIGSMIEAIEGILARGHGYAAGGEVFYSIDSFASYGGLSGKNLEELAAGQRVEVNPNKKNPLDFILWKPSEQGVPAWDSPWGPGRPGWHIECSAMVRTLLGESIDIHGGGIDLIFPHHENEIAQGEACTGQSYCRYWMHNQFIQFKNQKMSKSLGNVITARAFMDEYHPEVLKFIMLSSHYRSLLQIDDQRIDNALAGLSRIYKALKKAATVGGESPQLAKALGEHDAAITKALNDDFNTGEMLAHIYEGVRFFNSQKSGGDAFSQWILRWGRLCALFQEDAAEFLQTLRLLSARRCGLDVAQVENLVAQRERARRERNWEESDRLRQQLKDLGVEVQDGSGGSEWDVGR